jgi:nucleoside-diphosphate-sugar epimerase
MRVLVTGATGLIGRDLVRAFAAQGHEVVALSRDGRAVDGADGMAVDLLDPSTTREVVGSLRAEGLVHLAWYDGPGRMAADANHAWERATVVLMKAFARAGGRRVVGAGSCAEYDWRRDVPHVEDAQLEPQSLYGQAKASAGIATMGALGLSAVWGRIFFVYGPNEPEGRLLGDVISGLRAGTPVDCTDGQQMRDFLSTVDIAAAFLHLFESEAEGAVNVASGTAIPVRDLIEETARQIGRPELIRLGTRPRPSDDPARIAADVTRLSALGFTPGFSLAEGVRDALERTPCR